MSQTPISRVSQIAKDFGMKNKEAIALIEEAGLGTKPHTADLTPDEFNLFFDQATKSHEIGSLDSFMTGKTAIDSPRLAQVKEEAEAKAKAEAEAKAKAEAEAKAKAEAEAKAKAEAEAKAKAEAEAKAKAEAEAKAKAEAEAKAKAEAEAKAKAEAEAKAKAEAEAKAKAEAEAKAKAEVARKSERPAKPEGNRPDGGRKPQDQTRRTVDTRPAAGTPSVQFSQDKRPQNQSVQTPKNVAINIQNQGMQGARKQRQQPVSEKKRTGNTRVVDTRGGGNVNLSKYDERLEHYGDGVSDAESTKQKLKKQNNRDMRSGKNRNKEQNAMDKLRRESVENAKKKPLQITIPEEISVSELASRLKVTAAEVVKRLMQMGMLVTVNQTIDYDTAFLVADELGAIATKEVVVTIEEKLFNEEEDTDDNLSPRSPVVCVMGHVDHGKTSLLDKIRNSNVTDGEAGGITQHIGAYRVRVNDQDITFLDTPGHEAFTAMRARGAQATDVAILVVAADDGIMPQTIEAINHAKAAGVEIIVAINKMDKPAANPEGIKADLTKYELVPEEWGGDVMCIPVSAHTGMGIDTLLESVLLIAEMKELKANPARRAKGIVIEAKLDKGRGPVATVLVQNGTLKSGDILIAGTSVGRVRAMTNDKGERVKEAGPSVPVEIIGLSEVPAAGDEFNAVEDERMARELAEQRRDAAKEEVFAANAKVSLNDLFAQISEGIKDLNIIVKADVDGSAEAVKQSLEKLSNEEVRVRVIHSAAGGITEGDVTFAAASNAIIVGFNVRPDKAAIDSAEDQKVDVRTYRIIYECIEEITAAMKGMLAPKFREVILGHAEVRQTIRVPGVGTIAGSYVQDGKVSRNALIRIVRDGVVIFEDKISSLKRFKDDAREVAQGYECGVGLEKYNDIHEGDILEAFIMEEIER